MVRRIHDHHGGDGGSIRECDRPPPTSYRDEHEVFHPGPGAVGYRQHIIDCTVCATMVGEAVMRGERWAIERHRPGRCC